nr:PIG-L family deacetylase [Phycisphaerae bacterium]NIP50912.1 PIG-L family deacetylase [Phycisphaerae bacterium]NIW91847.1 GlcNAc-PI de-N-acetylase [Phycisphaerae bacterium]NIX26753.1 GlcNAc-PI de-N-acetylase [Phycisphaerae bacterium]
MLKFLACLAHPDDESLGMGGALARYAAEGVETYLVTATRGERGWPGKPEDNPGLQKLGEIRTAELQEAAEALGIREVNFLDYVDGDLDQADSIEATRKIVTHLRRIQPQVLATFDPFGAYGHPDHIAISQLTTGAVVAAASPDYVDDAQQPPHQVQKLYFMGWTPADQLVY